MRGLEQVEWSEGPGTGGVEIEGEWSEGPGTGGVEIEGPGTGGVE